MRSGRLPRPRRLRTPWRTPSRWWISVSRSRTREKPLVRRLRVAFGARPAYPGDFFFCRGCRRHGCGGAAFDSAGQSAAARVGFVLYYFYCTGGPPRHHASRGGGSRSYLYCVVRCIIMLFLFLATPTNQRPPPSALPTPRPPEQFFSIAPTIPPAEPYPGCTNNPSRTVAPTAPLRLRCCSHTQHTQNCKKIVSCSTRPHLFNTFAMNCPPERTPPRICWAPSRRRTEFFIRSSRRGPRRPRPPRKVRS